MDGKYVRCLMVETGREEVVRRLLEIRHLGHGLFPQRVRIRKFRGVWHRDHARLLPGYVFVYADEEIPVRHYFALEHVLRVLRYDREPDGYLHGNDLEFARTFSELDGKLDILNAVDEEGFIHVTDTLLQTLGGEVVKVDRGKRLVKIRVDLMGQTKILYMNYQLVDGEGRPLTPAEEMVEDETDEWLTAWTPDFADDLAETLDRKAEEQNRNSGEPKRDAEKKAPGYIHDAGTETDLVVAAAELEREALLRWEEAERAGDGAAAES